MNITRTLAVGTTGALVAGLIAFAPAATAATDVNVAPLRTVTGGLNGTIGVDHDSSGNLYIASQANNSVVVHAANAVGNAGSLRTLNGAATGLATPRDVALDSNGFLWVVNLNGMVNVFGPGQSGNVAPVKTFGTGAGSTFGIDIAANGEVYVRKAAGYNVYAPSASGNPAPTLRAVTGLGNGFSIAVTGGKVWTPNGTQLRAYATSADGAAAPQQTVVDAFVGASEVNGVDTDKGSRVYATSFSTNTVKVFAGNANGIASPLKVLGGPATGLNLPTGLTVLANGNTAVGNFGGVNSVSTFKNLFPVAAPSKARSLKVGGAAKAKKRTVSWKAPSSDGGAKITGYRIVVKKGSKTLLTKNVSGSKRSVKIARSKLRNGSNTVYIKAKNSSGFGPTAKKSFKVKK